jgi:hypothetical protein
MFPLPVSPFIKGKYPIATCKKGGFMSEYNEKTYSRGYYLVTTKDRLFPIAMFLDKGEAESWSKEKVNQPIIEYHSIEPEFFQAFVQYLGFPKRLQHNRNQSIGRIEKPVPVLLYSPEK